MRLEEHMVSSHSDEYARKIWILEPDHLPPSSIAIFLDGEFYLNNMEAPSLLLRLQDTGNLPPILCAFVSHVNGEARHRDLTCNPRYNEFVANDLVDWLSRKSDMNSKGGHLIAGASLGGLAAAYAALIYPARFSRCLSQSGSFWWNDEWMAHNLSHMPPSGGRYWLSVGDQETASGISHPPTGLRQNVTQIDACENLATELSKSGRSVHYSVYEGGHEFKPWQDELPRALTWLCK